jgi:hypothetical protein
MTPLEQLTEGISQSQFCPTEDTSQPQSYPCCDPQPDSLNPDPAVADQTQQSHISLKGRTSTVGSQRDSAVSIQNVESGPLGLRLGPQYGLGLAT